MTNINDKNPINLLDSINDSEEIQSLMAEVQETFFGFGFSKNEITREKKELLSYYINYHSDKFKYTMTNDDSLSPSEPQEPSEPSTPQEVEISSAELSINDVVNMYEEVPYELIVEPQTSYKVELKADGDVLRVSEDGKTIYAVDSGLGWVSARVYNDINEITIGNKEIKSKYKSFTLTKPIVELNNKETQNYITSRYDGGNDISLLDVDNNKDNLVTYKMEAVDDDSNTFILPKEIMNRIIYPLGVSTYFDNIAGEVVAKKNTEQKYESIIPLLYNFKNIAFSQSEDLDTEYLTEKRVNILNNTDSSHFTKANWTTNIVTTSEKNNVKQVENGLHMTGDSKIISTIDRKFSPSQSPVIIPDSFNNENPSKYFSIRVTFKAKGQGLIYTQLLNSFGSDIIDKSLIPSINVVALAEEREFTQIIKIPVRNVQSSLLKYIGFKTESKNNDGVTIIEDSISVISEFNHSTLEQGGEIYPPDTELFDYIGIPIKDNPSTKMDYVWFRDNKIINRNANVIKLYPIHENSEYTIRFDGYGEELLPELTLDNKTLSITEINTPKKFDFSLLNERQLLDNSTISDKIRYEFDGEDIEFDDQGNIVFTKRGIKKVKVVLDNVGNSNDTISKDIEFIILDNLDIIGDNEVVMGDDPENYYSSGIYHNGEYYKVEIDEETINNYNRQIKIHGVIYNAINPMMNNEYNESFNCEEELDKVELSSENKGIKVINNIINLEDEHDKEFTVNVNYKRGYEYVYLINLLTNEIRKIEQEQVTSDNLHELSHDGEYQLLGFSYKDAKSIDDIDCIVPLESMFNVNNGILPLSKPIKIQFSVYE